MTSSSKDEQKQNSTAPNETSAGAPSTEPCHLFYLSEEAALNLPRFQYRGKDLSFVYHYVLSPLAAFCVDWFTPPWMAPNTITLSGLGFMITSYAAMWYYAPTLETPTPDEMPRWIYLWHGICLLTYQTLDNMDGKQARKTGSSSPLGLLFDHGIDAINSIFGSANWMISLMLHPVRDVALCFSVLFGPYGLFFVSTWEEYYTGELILPIINGPNEGLLGGVFMSFMSFWYGPAFWQQSTVWEEYVLPTLAQVFPAMVMERLPSKVRHADILVLVASIGFVQEMVLKIIHVARTYGVASMRHLAPFAALVASALLVGYTDLDIWLSAPRTSLHLCSALFVDMTTALMMAHITEQEYRLRDRWLLIPLICFTFGVCVGWIRSSRETDDFLLVYSAAAVAHIALKFAIVIHEVCAVLNIWCFDITTPRQSQERINGETLQKKIM